VRAACGLVPHHHGGEISGSVIVGGGFTTAGGLAAANIARWNGAVWSALGSGTNGTVRTLVTDPNGNTWVGGDFTIAGGRGCGFVARLATPCSPAVVPFGSGCQGSGGLNELTPITLPWQGGRFRSRATGLSNGLAVALAGLATIQVPLPQLLPMGATGCDLHIAPIVLDLFAPATGSAELELLLPATAIAPGAQVFQQVVSLEIDAVGALTAATSSNGLRLVVGAM
jgi:hypothetical protein